MRIRQVRPEFFSDPLISRAKPDVRLTYIGLWCVADDAGWLVWDVANIGALLYPYESVRVRERRVERAGATLTELGRVVVHECGCALIPKLETHQRIGGNKSFTARDRHRVHTVPDKSAGKLGNGKRSNGRLEARERATTEEERADQLAAFRRQGLPVDVAS